ncbi:MAG TPA: transcriptional regulator [Pirellulales bacterium]|jgi:DNA-binding MarR family transcriptional regulator|nr:transcriptional regulator [Pirellulales bacterium]
MSAPDSASETSGRFAYEGLERPMHEKARLGIMTSLVTHPEGLLFNDLKELCSLTDGNLNRHLKVLHDEGLIEIRKSAGGKRPQTVCRVTASGRQRFLEYVAELERVIADAAAAARARSRTSQASANRSRQSGWSPA